MELSIKKEQETRVEFSLNGISIPFANMFRKYTMTHVPVFAIESVTFYENTSSLFDEYLSHRLGLLPLTTPKKVLENAEVTFSLDAEGPQMVYAGSLKSTDADVVVAREKVPLATLSPQQTIKLECKAIIATGRKHAKFQSGIVSYEITEGKVPTFNFMVESFSQMNARELTMRSLDILETQVEDLGKALKKEAK